MNTENSDEKLEKWSAKDRYITCKTSDNQMMSIKVSYLLQSTVFRQMYESLNMDKMSVNDPNFIFKVEISFNQLERVKDWCSNHLDINDPVVVFDPLTYERKWFTLNDYEKEFFNVSDEMLLEYIKTANYLDIKTMYLYGCQTLANLIKSKKEKEICDLLGLEEDLTEEQKKEIMKRNAWCMY